MPGVLLIVAVACSVIGRHVVELIASVVNQVRGNRGSVATRYRLQRDFA